MSANIDQKDQIEITPEMYEAGKRILIESGILSFPGVANPGELGCEGDIAVDIYLAMRQASKKL